MIAARLGLVPWGTLSGLPALLLDVDGPIDAPDHAGQKIARACARLPGVRVAWIRSAPWADDAFATLIDEAFGDLGTVCGEQALDAREWGYRDVHWFVDGSRLLSSSATPESVADSVARLPGYPTPAEVLVRDPLPANISAALLRAVAASVGGESTLFELQIQAVDADRAIKATIAMSSLWRTRQAGGVLPTEFPLLEL